MTVLDIMTVLYGSLLSGPVIYFVLTAISVSCTIIHRITLGCLFALLNNRFKEGNSM
jgi:hypothetical protein